jgi:glycosyltransferase involved in cell wall biosynthesis
VAEWKDRETTKVSMKIACVIPAYNESTRIGAVLRPVVESKLFDRVIVVDDGSTNNLDLSIEVWERFKNVELYRLPVNKGKSFAVARAVKYLDGGVDYVCLLDADLEGLTYSNLLDLVGPIRYHDCRKEKVNTTISRRRSYGGLFYPKLDIFTGERVLPLSLLEECKLESRSSFEMEAVINGALICSHARIKVVDWPNVTNPSKMAKYGTWQGVKKDWRMFREMSKVGGVTMLMRQKRKLGRMLV